MDAAAKVSAAVPADQAKGAVEPRKLADFADVRPQFVEMGVEARAWGSVGAAPRQRTPSGQHDGDPSPGGALQGHVLIGAALLSQLRGRKA